MDQPPPTSALVVGRAGLTAIMIWELPNMGYLSRIAEVIAN